MASAFADPAKFAPSFAAAAPDSAAMMLQVLTGRLAGASYPMNEGVPLRVGHSLRNDVVLRGKTTAGIGIEICYQGHDAIVRVLEGGIMLLGRPMTTGESTLLPAYLPLRIGEYSFAIGAPDSPRWADAERIAAQELPVVHPSAEDDGEATDDTQAGGLHGLRDRVEHAVTPLRHYLPRGGIKPGWLMAGAGALLLLAAANPVMSIIQQEVYNPKSAQAVLAAAGFKGLTVRRDPATAGFLISGIVPADADIARLRQFTDERLGGATLDVTTGTAIAAAATDLMQSQGVDAQATYRRGGIVFNSEFLPNDRQQELAAIVKRDLPAAGAINFVHDPNKGPKDLQYFFNSPEYGLATFVDGNPGHIVTADGQYWFQGATLPTGHKLVAIGNGRIALERNGLIEELRPVAPQGPGPAATVAGTAPNGKDVL